MNDWNEGYFTESTYTYGYYPELNPTFQRFCLLTNGVLTPPPLRMKITASLATGRAFL